VRGFLGLLGLTLALSLAACGKPAPKAADVAAGKLFLIRNSAAPGVITTPSGLQYRVIHSGPADGLRPKLADEVKVNYEGKLLNGEVFDSSFDRGSPSVMQVREVIPGWQEALQLMRPGDEWLIYVPPSLAYGDRAAGPIPPGSVLMFRLELLGVAPDSTSVGKG
jgi:peptidylprolyl isomerase/FKBP-type peptidyl-prolyl cis-trans isomerase FklB